MFTMGPGGCHVAVTNHAEERGGAGKAKASARRPPPSGRDQCAVGPCPRAMTMSCRTQPCAARASSIAAFTLPGGAVSVKRTLTRSWTQPACELGSLAQASIHVAAIVWTEASDAPAGTADRIVSRDHNPFPLRSPPGRESAVSARTATPTPHNRRTLKETMMASRRERWLDLMSRSGARDGEGASDIDFMISPEVG
jgi:hypothetical protein